MNSFEICKAQGVKVQELVKHHLENRGHTIIDVSEDAEYQCQDIDFIVENGEQRTTLEVKKDKSLFTTKNIFIEAGFRRDSYYTLGWLKKCKAEYICYYDTTRRKGIIVDFPLIKSLLEPYAERRCFYDKYDDKEGMAFLLPFGIAQEKGAVVYSWED